MLKGRIPGFVGRDDFGLASGRKPDGTFGRVWYKEQISSDEVSFDENVFLVKKDKALACQITPLTSSRQVPTWSMPKNEPSSGTKLPHQQEPDKVPEPSQIPEESERKGLLHIHGSIPPELRIFCNHEKPREFG
ncbi:MAG: hypothetical protein HQK89_07695 [Nitrospirae bacterium]|nr:hypothetical protein [Nitrospirota bacterium]